MTITSAELKNNLNKYLHLAETEDVFVTKNGRVMCKLSPVYEDKIAIVESLIDVVPNGAIIDEGKNERLKRHETTDWYMCCS